MAARRLLIVGNTVITSWGRDQIRRMSEQARRRGIYLIGADTPGNLASASSEELACVDEVVPLDVHDPQACGEWAAERSDIDAIVTVRELAVYSAAIIARELGLPGNDPQAVHRIRNKDLARGRLRDLGFPQPATALCQDAAEAERFMRAHGPGPWVVKPRDGLASIGVRVLSGPDDLPMALAQFGGPPSAFGSVAASPRFLIETFISGEEFSAEGVMLGRVPHVLALTRKSVESGLIETGHQIPAGLDQETADAATEAVAGALVATGISRGIFHVEFWVTSRGIVLGELHDRPGGDYIHLLVEHTRPGLELYGALIDDLFGLPPALLPEPKGAAAAAFLICPPGHLTAVRGWDELVRHPAVLAADLSVRPGDTVQPVTDSFGRHGVFVVEADTTDAARQLVSDLTAAVTFEVS